MAKQNNSSKLVVRQSKNPSKLEFSPYTVSQENPYGSGAMSTIKYTSPALKPIKGGLAGNKPYLTGRLGLGLNDSSKDIQLGITSVGPKTPGKVATDSYANLGYNTENGLNANAGWNTRLNFGNAANLRKPGDVNAYMGVSPQISVGKKLDASVPLTAGLEYKPSKLPLSLYANASYAPQIAQRISDKFNPNEKFNVSAGLKLNIPSAKIKKNPKPKITPSPIPEANWVKEYGGQLFADGGPLNDINKGQYLNSVYASALGNYYANGGQFTQPYSLPEDSFKQGGNNLHNSIYASSAQQYPAPYRLGGNMNEATRQQMYMPLDHVTKNGGSILSMSNTPQLEGEGKDLSEPKNSYIYNLGGLMNDNMKNSFNNMGFMSLPKEVQNKIRTNSFAEGGPLTEFNEGGTHEENPLGGIPQGVAPDGGVNLVEQGETKLDSANYIFSDTLKVDKETATGLGLSNVVGKTFADVSKKIDRPNSRRENDSIEENAKKKELDSLMQAQEEFKKREAAKKLEEIQSLDPNLLGSLMGQGQPQGQPPVDQQMGIDPSQAPMEQGQPPMDPSQMDPAMMQQMMAQQGGAPQGAPMQMALGGPLHQYGLGGFGDVMRNYGLGMADTMLSTVGAGNVVQDSAYKGQGSEFMKKASNVMGGIGKAALPMAANFIAPGLGSAVAGGIQQGIGSFNPQDERITNAQKQASIVPSVNTQQGLPVNYKLGGGMHKYDGISEPTGQMFNAQYPSMYQGFEPLGGDPYAKLPLKNAYIPDTINKTPQNPFTFQGPNDSEDNTNYQDFLDSSSKKALEMEKFGQVQNENGDWVDKSTVADNYEEQPLYNSPDASLSDLEQDLVQDPTTGEWVMGKADADTHVLNDKQKDLEGTNLKQSGLNALGTYTPVAYNIGMGLFSKPQQLKAEDYYTKANIKPWEYNADPELAAVRAAYAGAAAGLKNTQPGAGAYLTNRTALANQQAMGERGVLANKQNIDAQNYMQAQLANKQFESQNAQTKLAIADWNAKAKAAKRDYLQAGLGQLGQISQSDTANQLGLAYAKMNAPDMGEKFNYTGWIQAKLAAIKANQKAKQGR